MKRIWLTLVGVLAVLFSAAAVRAADWPGWRGPTGLGFADEKDLPLTWNARTGENVLWKSPLPGTAGKERRDHNQSSPIVRGGRVFVATAFWPAGAPPEKEYPEHHVTCYRASDGKQLWDTRVKPGPWLLKDLRGGYSAPTPVADGERVYVLFGSSVLAALDFEGKPVWRKEIVPFTFDVAIGTSPILYRDTVIVLCSMANPRDSAVKAFDSKTGDLKWAAKRPTMTFGHTTPAVIEVNGKHQMVISASGASVTPQGIFALDPADGHPIWWCQGSGDVPTPAYGSGLVFAVDGRGGQGRVVDPTGEGDVTKTHLKWTSPRIPDGTFSSPIIVDGLLYQLQNPGVLRCWKVTSGKPVYEERLPGVATAPSPVATPDGRLYFASAGKSFVIQASPQFKVLATNDLGDEASASPAVAGGRIFLKGRRFLYCIGKKD